MEIWFYQLNGQTPEKALPALLEKALQRGWRVVVQTVDDLRVKVLDEYLWTYRPESFLPHASSDDKTAARQPILLTRDAAANANSAEMRIYVEGAEIEVDSDALYRRLILVFDGANELELEAARRQWSRLKTSGAELAYWRQKEGGGWERQS